MLFATHIYFNMLITMSLFSCSVLFNSLRPYGRRLPCPFHLPELAQTLSVESAMPSDHLILCRPLLLPLQSFPVVSNESHQVAKVLDLPLQHQSF